MVYELLGWLVKFKWWHWEFRMWKYVASPDLFFWGKPKKGRGASRDTKRTRPSADPDFDYDDDADLTLWKIVA
jgi:hypothetical protein